MNRMAFAVNSPLRILDNPTEITAAPEVTVGNNSVICRRDSAFTEPPFRANGDSVISCVQCKVVKYGPDEYNDPEIIASDIVQVPVSADVAGDGLEASVACRLWLTTNSEWEYFGLAYCGPHPLVDDADTPF